MLFTSRNKFSFHVILTSLKQIRFYYCSYNMGEMEIMSFISAAHAFSRSLRDGQLGVMGNYDNDAPSGPASRRLTESTCGG